MTIDVTYQGEQDGSYTYRISYDNIGELIFIMSEYEITLERLFVESEFRKKGIARELLNILEYYARKSGYKNIISPVLIQRDIVLYLEAFGFYGCDEEDKIGVEQIRMAIPKEENIKILQGLIIMCKELG